MSERILGTIYLSNSDGESERNVNVSVTDRERGFVDGPNGTLIIDAWKIPPMIQGKGDVYVLDEEGKKVRHTRIKKGETCNVVISTGDRSDFNMIGNVTYLTVE